MRWKMGAPPTDVSFDPNKTGWIPLKLPSPYVLLAMGIPVSLLTAILLSLGWRVILPANLQMTAFFPGLSHWSPVIVLLLLLPTGVLVIFVHELLHCAGHPRMGFSSSSYIGAWPSRFMFYSVYLGDIMRNRYLFLGLLPFLIISVLPLILCLLLDTSPGVHTSILAFGSIVNGICSCGDLLLVPVVYWQIPKNSSIRDQGWKMYWKKADQLGSSALRSEHG